MARDQEWHELNDRVAQLAARVAALDGLVEDGAHPAVTESAVSGGIVAEVFEQLPLSRVGREHLARRKGAMAPAAAVADAPIASVAPTAAEAAPAAPAAQAATVAGGELPAGAAAAAGGGAAGKGKGAK